jgi:tetratricopeptide (TPR) repeat protein
LALQPHNSRAYAMRASAFASSGKTTEALADLEQAIQKDSRNPENYLLRATLHQQQGQAKEALDDYGQAIQMAPDSERAYLGRAEVLRTHGKVQESLADCYKAIQLNPVDTAAYLCRAQFYLSTGAAQPALEDINRAMLMGQKPAEAVALLSEARKMVDAKEQAAAQPKQAPAPPQTPPQQALVAQAPASAPAVAAPAVREAVPVAAPVTPPRLAAEGSVASVRPPQLAPRRVSVPPQVLTPVVNSPVVSSKEARGPRDANRLYREGRYLSEQENFEEAEQAFTQAIQMDPTLALALNARGYVRLRLRRYQAAIDDCSQAIRLNPAYGNAFLNRSVAKRALGDIAGAREDQRHAVELGGIAQATLAKPPSRP